MCQLFRLFGPSLGWRDDRRVGAGWSGKRGQRQADAGPRQEIAVDRGWGITGQAR